MSRRGTLQVSVPPTLEDTLRTMAARENRTLSNMIQVLIEEGLQRRAIGGEYFSSTAPMLPGKVG